MGRTPKAWYWEARGSWHAVVNGRRRTLAKGSGREARMAAERELHRILADSPHVPTKEADPGGRLVREIVAMFLDHARETVKPITVDFYAKHLDDFKSRCGTMLAKDIKPFHVSEWVSSHRWADATKRGAITCLKRAFSWASKEGYLDSDPIANVKKPAATRRQEIPTSESVEAMRKVIKTRAFLDFLFALCESGCRPGEAAKVAAKDYDGERGLWVLEGKTTRATGKMRVVFLTPALMELCDRLAKEHPTGPLFRNSRGDPWKRHAYGGQFRRLREKAKLGKEAVAYGIRHLWATDAIDRGVPIATVAEMMGHRGTAMLDRYYNHISDRPDHFREALAKIRPPKG